jgi:hypothetical protein
MKTERGFNFSVWGGFAAVLTVLSLSAAAPLHRQTSKDAMGPVGVGETLTYRVEWSPPWYLFFLPNMEAGEVRLALMDANGGSGRKALKIDFTARSSGTLARMAGVNVDDHFQSYVDPETLCTFSVSKRIREGKRKRNVEVEYFASANRLRIRQVNTAVDPPKVDRDEYVDEVPACVRDIFAALYDTRRRELKPGAAHRLLVGDDDKVKQVEAKIEKRETVKVPFGRFEAWKVETKALFGGLFKDGGQFLVWMTADEQKVPIKFEVKVKLGKVTGELTSLDTAAESVAEDRSRP